MSAPRLTPIDAQSFWMSAKIPNDTVLLFAFDGVPADVDEALQVVRAQARRCPELAVRIDDTGRIGYPVWQPGEVRIAQVVAHRLEDASWSTAVDAVVELTADALDARQDAWRLHVLPGVEGVPGTTGAGTVAVLQISHALGGGGRTASSAALLFGRRGALPELIPLRSNVFRLTALGLRAARAHRRLLADTEAGAVAPPAPLRPVIRTNAAPSGARGVRVVVRRRAELSGPTVTVAVLVAIADALAGHLHALGEDPSTLAAELTIAKPPPRNALNHFGTAGVGLYPALPATARAERISADVAARRARAAHPAMRAADHAFAATPARLLRWAVGRFDPAVRVPAVTGNTVVSSVNGGPADYAFGGAPVVLLAAFPGLSPMMGLTHCVSGVGDTISVGVHAAASAIGDLDGYVARLEAALGG